MRKKYQIIAALAVIIAGGLALVWVRQARIKKPAIQPKSAIEIKTVALDENQAPDKFPANFPSEKTGSFLLNENLTAGEGATLVKQGRREFVSSKTLTENYEIYKKYILENKWSLISTTNADDVKSLTAVKGLESLTIILSKNSDGKTLVSAAVEYK